MHAAVIADAFAGLASMMTVFRPMKATSRSWSFFAVIILDTRSFDKAAKRSAWTLRARRPRLQNQSKDRNYILL